MNSPLRYGFFSLLLSTLASATPATAELFTVRFAGDLADLGDSFSAQSERNLDNSPGVAVEVSAFSIDSGGLDAPFSPGDGLPIIQNEDGIGVSSGLTDFPDNLGLQVDGLGNGEVLQFLFPMNVRLTRIFFSRVSTGDQFDLAIGMTDQVGDARDVDVAASLGGDDNIDTAGNQVVDELFEVVLPASVTFTTGDPGSGAPVGRLFQLYSQDDNDSFTVARIEFEDDEDADPNEQVVPEPTGLAIALLGLSAVITRSRRRASRC